jgi:hypothetical protein
VTSTQDNLTTSAEPTRSAMNEDRVQQFESEVSGMKVRGASRDTEKWLQILAVAGLVGGIVLVIVGAIQVSGTSDTADQNSMLATSTFVGLALTIAGAALFVRVSFGRMLRYWLVRLVHEQRSETDRLIEAIKNRDS